MSAYDWRNDPMFEGIEDPEPEPTRPARTGQDGPREVTEADRAWAAEASARGSFLPPIKVPGATRRLGPRRNDRWGKALKNWKDAGCQDVPPK